ncbi:hypothetical protein HY448_01335 [Candidatus Pacearchaeota archaeon]|nr:hypothetical protein [Candidatus Pacearchaeota archaeon]
MDFLFHNVSEKEKEEIKQEAKDIMDSFSKKISKVKKKIPESFIERKDFEREEKQGAECDNDFRRRMLENAPNKNESFIIAEKKKW